MDNEIKKGREVYIIPQDIADAETGIVSDVLDGCFTVRLNSERNFSIGSRAEFFSIENGGRIYFESIIKNVSGSIITVWMPPLIQHLQRREYARIPENGAIQLHNGRKSIDAAIIDISPGGMRVKTDIQIELLEQYKSFLNIENTEIPVVFVPARMEAADDGFYISGKFSFVSNNNRIVLAQYCFRRKIEISAV